MRCFRSENARILKVSGGELAILRKNEGLTQSDLAEVTGLHKNTIANIERGKVDASVLALSLMQVHLRAIGVTIEKEGFLPCPAPSQLNVFPFPQLIVPASVMASVMGKLVHGRRLERGISLEDLARVTGIHPNTIWNFEKGLVAASISTTYRIYRGIDFKWVGGSSQGLIFQ